MWLLALVFICGIGLGIYNLIFKRTPKLDGQPGGMPLPTGPPVPKQPYSPTCDYCGSVWIADKSGTCKGCGAPRPKFEALHWAPSHPMTSGGHTLPTFLIRMATGGSPYPPDPRPNRVKITE